MNGSTQSQFDEVDIFEYVRVLLRQSFFIAAVTVFAIAAALAFSILTPKIYRVISVLQVGTLVDGDQGQGKLIEAPVQIVEKIGNDIYGAFIREMLAIPEQEYPRVFAEYSKDTKIVRILAEGEDAQKTKEVVETLTNSIISDHTKKISLQSDLVSKAIKTNEKNALILKGETGRIREKIRALQDEQNVMEAKVTALQSVLAHEQTIGTQFAFLNAKDALTQKRQEIEDRYLEISSIDQRVNGIEQANQTLENKIKEIEATQVIRTPLVPKIPVYPKTKINMVIGALAGLIAGIFIAFMREWWKKSSHA